MNSTKKVLIIEDHPITSLAYKSAFESINGYDDISFVIEQAYNCDDALDMINRASKFEKYDIIFLDINLPISKQNQKIRSGEDLGIIINQKLPDVKILVSTTYYDNVRIQSIIKNVDPDAFLVKNDVTPDILIEAIKTVLDEPPFYSKTALQSFRKRLVNDQLLDEIDRQLLYELSIGTRMKELPKLLPLSMAGVEKRKRQLKELFDVGNKDDRELIIKAKEKGFL